MTLGALIPSSFGRPDFARPRLLVSDWNVAAVRRIQEVFSRSARVLAGIRGLLHEELVAEPFRWMRSQMLNLPTLSGASAHY